MAMSEERKKVTPTIIVHGGAGNIPKTNNDDWRLGIQKAVRAGYEVLCASDTSQASSSTSSSALDAVEAAVRGLEDYHVFNAGTVL